MSGLRSLLVNAFFLRSLIELDSATGNIVEWGLCNPNCPQEVAEIVCLDEPQFPDFVYDGEDDIFVNFTTEYERGSEVETRDVSFEKKQTHIIG